MNLTHAHLLMNHLPIWGSIFAFFMILYSFRKENIEMLKLFLWVLVFLALVTILVFLTGDIIDEQAKLLPGVNESAIEDHETAGWVSMIIMEAAGVLALIEIFILRKSGKVEAWFKYAFISLMILCIISFAWAAYLGGEIRHPEIMSN